MKNLRLRPVMPLQLAAILVATGMSLAAQQPNPPDTPASRVELSIRQPPVEQRNEYLTLFGNIAWPLVTALSIWAMRKPLGDFLVAIGNRATKLSVPGLALELPTAAEPKARLDVSLEEIRNPTSGAAVSDSSRALLSDLASTEPSDYVIVDIGDGREWLTSRLFIVAQLFPRMRGVKVVVFLASSSNGTQQFIGLVEASRLRWALAEQYPWLEWALVEAFAMEAASAAMAVAPAPAATVMAPAPAAASMAPVSAAVGMVPAVVNVGIAPALAGPQITSHTGALDPTIVSTVVYNYLNAIQAPLPSDEPQTWVDLGGRWERAEWIDRRWFSRVLGGDLQNESFTQDSSVPIAEVAQRVLRIKDVDFAAGVTGGLFVKLVNRRKLLERLAARAAEQDKT